VINVVDGDTVDINIDLGFYIFTTLRFRLDFIDAHEIRGATEEEEALGREEADYLEKLVLGKEVQLFSSKTGKYGRWICELWFDDKNINMEMDRFIHDPERIKDL